jgi:hypothetical protein
MGFDGLISFLIRNLPNDTFDEVNLIKNYNRVVSKYILIDISFILYNCYIEIENDINLILKYIYALSCTDYNEIIKKLEKELEKKHWKNIKVPLDGETQDEISDNFIKFLTDNDNKIFLDLLSNYTCNKLKSILETLFELQFTSDVILFFDSIPSYSKILEQRKRRIKNYLESQNRKEYYQEYFSDLENDNVEEDNIEYDYFNWMKKKFNCNKIIDSNSVFVKHLKEYIIDNLKISDNVKIDVDKEEFGEADYKIFKYISSNKLDDNITILSCDSDLVYQLILQQYNYNYLNRNIKLGLFKFYVNSFEYCQYFNANKILNYISNNYFETNLIKEKKSTDFTLDFLFILNFFGNDFLPSSLELGPEISFNYLIKTYYQVFGKKSDSIVNPEYNNNKLLYNLDFNNLKLWLEELSKLSSYTKIILLRYYKVPYNITFILTDKLRLSLSEIRDKIIKPYLIYHGMKLKDSLENNDIRLLLYNDYINVKESKDESIKNPLDCNNYPNSLGVYLEQLNELLEDYLDFNDLENYGLKNNSHMIEIEDNMYQNLYNYISKKSNINDRDVELSFDMEIEVSDNNKTEEFLLMLYFIVTNFFNDMEFYKSTNLTRYSYSSVPSLASIISFINTNDMKKIKTKFDALIKYNILEKNKYIDSTLHHLIITPYLMDSNYLELLDNKELLKNIISNFDDTLQQIWCNNETDLFLKRNPKILLRSWVDLLYKINCQNVIEVDNKLMIEI